MPNLVNLDLILSDREDDENPPFKQSLRLEFAEAVPLLPSSVRHLALVFESKLPKVQFHDAPYGTHGNSPHSAAPGHDPLSDALGTFSQQLVIFDVSRPTTLSHSIFTATEKVSWPRLESLWLSLSKITPEGKWRFNREVAEDSEAADDDHASSSDSFGEDFDNSDEDMRVVLDHGAADEVLLATAHGALRMPKLKSLTISFDRTQAWVEYTAREGRSLLYMYAEKRKVELSEVTKKAWQAVAQTLGNELDISSVSGPERDRL